MQTRSADTKRRTKRRHLCGDLFAVEEFLDVSLPVLGEVVLNHGFQSSAWEVHLHGFWFAREAEFVSNRSLRAQFVGYYGDPLAIFLDFELESGSLLIFRRFGLELDQSAVIAQVFDVSLNE